MSKDRLKHFGRIFAQAALVVGVVECTLPAFAEAPKEPVIPTPRKGEYLYINPSTGQIDSEYPSDRTEPIDPPREPLLLWISPKTPPELALEVTEPSKNTRAFHIKRDIPGWQPRREYYVDLKQIRLIPGDEIK